MKRGHVIGLNLERGGNNNVEGPAVTVDGQELKYAGDVTVTGTTKDLSLKVTITLTAAYVGGLSAAQAYLAERALEEAKWAEEKERINTEGAEARRSLIEEAAEMNRDGSEAPESNRHTHEGESLSNEQD